MFDGEKQQPQRVADRDHHLCMLQLITNSRQSSPWIPVIPGRGASQPAIRWQSTDMDTSATANKENRGRELQDVVPVNQRYVGRVQTRTPRRQLTKSTVEGNSRTWCQSTRVQTRTPQRELTKSTVEGNSRTWCQSTSHTLAEYKHGHLSDS